jgi:hypothetical protein
MSADDLLKWTVVHSPLPIRAEPLGVLLLNRSMLGPWMSLLPGLLPSRFVPVGDRLILAVQPPTVPPFEPRSA